MVLDITDFIVMTEEELNAKGNWDISCPHIKLASIPRNPKQLYACAISKYKYGEWNVNKENNPCNCNNYEICKRYLNFLETGKTEITQDEVKNN